MGLADRGNGLQQMVHAELSKRESIGMITWNPPRQVH